MGKNKENSAPDENKTQTQPNQPKPNQTNNTTQPNPKTTQKTQIQSSSQNPTFPQFLVMSSTQSGKTTASLSPLLLRKGIKGIAGEVKSVKPLRSGDLLIEVYRRPQAENLLGTISFGGIGVSVKPHSSLNCSKGVIRCPALRNDTDADILAYFQEEMVPVSEVRRISTRKQGKLIPTHTFIITFTTPILPPTVIIGYQRYSVTVYIPNPLRCRNCQRYGHHERGCRRNAVCQFCCREGHTERDDCDIAGLRCANCEGEHAASSRDCPAWAREREVLRVKYTRGVSFPEARRLVESADIAGPTYSQVTRSRVSAASVTVKDASTQASEDRPAWGSQAPDRPSTQTCKILSGDPSRFKQISKPSNRPPQTTQTQNKQPVQTKQPHTTPAQNKRAQPKTSTPKDPLAPPPPPSSKNPSAPRPRSSSVPRTGTGSVSPTGSHQRKKLKRMPDPVRPDLNSTYGKGSDNLTNRFNLLLDVEDEMDTVPSIRLASPPQTNNKNK